MSDDNVSSAGHVGGDSISEYLPASAVVAFVIFSPFVASVFPGTSPSIDTLFPAHAAIVLSSTGVHAANRSNTTVVLCETFSCPRTCIDFLNSRAIDGSERGRRRKYSPFGLRISRRQCTVTISNEFGDVSIGHVSMTTLLRMISGSATVSGVGKTSPSSALSEVVYRARQLHPWNPFHIPRYRYDAVSTTQYTVCYYDVPPRAHGRSRSYERFTCFISIFQRGP